jgi:ABC-type tungstate transport system substrate-binding protein
MEYLGIKLWYTSSYMASANGKVERKHRELAYILGIQARQENENWYDHLAFVVFAVNTAFSRSLAETPFIYNI